MCSLRFAVTALVSVLAVALFSNAFLVNLLLSEEPQKPATTSSLPQPPRLISFESLRASLSVPEEELTTPRGEPRPPRLDPHRLLVRLRRPPFEDAPLLAGAGAAALWASPRELVSASPLELGQALAYLERAEVVRARTPRVGTQLKILLVLEGGWKALFKPQWYSREYQVEGGVYSGKDRHNAEVAAFHLSLLLDVRRTPLAAGRRLNMSDVRAKADADLAATFSRAEGKGTCLYGVCLYCKAEDSVCAQDGTTDLLEGTAILWLPSHLKLTKRRSPWQRTYKDGRNATWQMEDDYCVRLQRRADATYAVADGRRRLLDLVETAVFDFLIANGDRHHYEFADGYPDAAVLLLDNGKSFGRYDVDYLDILAPLYQCCRLRRSFFRRLEQVEQGPLSQLMRRLSRTDPVLHPVLADGHLDALDRRLHIVMRTVRLCVRLHGHWDAVLVS